MLGLNGRAAPRRFGFCVANEQPNLLLISKPKAMETDVFDEYRITQTFVNLYMRNVRLTTSQWQ